VTGVVCDRLTTPSSHFYSNFLAVAEAVNGSLFLKKEGTEGGLVSAFSNIFTW